MFQSFAQKGTRIPPAENQSLSNAPFSCTNMDVLANYSIFQELQLVHDTGYFSAMPSLEENWQQVNCFYLCFCNLSNFFFSRVSALLRCAQLVKTRQTIFSAFCVIATLRTIAYAFKNAMWLKCVDVLMPCSALLATKCNVAKHAGKLRSE